MKNLKKVLSLVLALAMALSLMTVAFAKDASDYTDYGTITNKEAVSVMTALGIIDGMGGGFNPTGNVTRAQMAKMITIISLGNVDPTAFLGTQTDLKDINGHWAEAYIKYCYSQGIISGKGNGIFDPNANVTSAEASKMLLTAIGYNAKVQGYTGPQWAINVTRDAQKDGLYTGVSVPANQALTRDEAAQMIYNAIDTGVIKATPHWDSATGTTSYSYEKQADSNDLLWNTFEVKTDQGVLNYDHTPVAYNKDKGEYTYEVGATPNSYTTTTDYTDLYQMNVKVLYKTNKDGTTTVYGIYPEKSTVIAEATLGAIDWTNYTSDIAKNVVDINGKEYKTTGTSITYYAANADAADATYSTVANTDAAKGYSMKAIDNTNDGKIDVIVYLPFTVAEVTYSGTTSVTMDNGVGNKKLEDISVYQGVAKDDQVVVIAAANTAKNVLTVTKAEVVSGKVTATKGSEICVNNNWYTLANGKTVTLGTEYDMAVVNGYVYDVDATTSEVKLSDYAVVTKAQNGASWDASYSKSTLLFADGTTKTVDVKDEDKAIVNALVTYEVSDDVYDLTAATKDTNKENATYCGFDVAENAAGSATYDVTKDLFTIGGNTYTVADDAVIFVKVLKADNTTVDKYEIVTGADLKKMGTVKTVLAAYGTKNASTGFTSVAMAFISTQSTSADNDTAYGYVTADLVKVLDKDNHEVYQITLGNGTVLTTKYGVSVSGIQKGSVISYKVTGNEVTTLAEVADTTAKSGGVAITGYDGKLLTVDSDAKTYEVTDDTVILYVDSSAVTSVEGGAVALALKDSSDAYVMNAAISAKVSANRDGNYELNLLVVDVNNNLYNATIS